MPNDIKYLSFAGPAAPLSAAVRVGELIFVSGMPGFASDGTLPDSFGEQFDLALDRLHDAITRAGGDMRRLVKVNVLLTREEDVADMNARYMAALGPAPFPARTTCVVRALPRPGMLVEIEAVAVALS